MFMFVCIWEEGIAVPRTFSFILQRITKKLSCEVACLGSNTTFIYIKDYFPQTRTCYHHYDYLQLGCVSHPRDHHLEDAGAHSLLPKDNFFFLLLKNIDTVSRLHLENHFTTESNEWQMERCCFLSVPSFLCPSPCGRTAPSMQMARLCWVKADTHLWQPLSSSITEL